jgi:hypothetical protein
MRRPPDNALQRVVDVARIDAARKAVRINETC